MVLPCRPETDVAEADGEPGENTREAGDGEQPIEDIVGCCFGEDCGVSDEPEEGGEKDGDERAPFAVDVAEYGGGLVLFCEGCEGAAGPVNGGIADGEDGDHYYD